MRYACVRGGVDLACGMTYVGSPWFLLDPFSMEFFMVAKGEQVPLSERLDLEDQLNRTVARQVELEAERRQAIQRERALRTRLASLPREG